MIDLETLDTKSSSVFLSIAAVRFDIETGERGETYSSHVDLDSQLKRGRTINADTLVWWMTKERKLFENMLYNAKPIEKVLTSFCEFIEDSSTEYVWSNSTRFDLGILTHALHALDYGTPWDYRCELDYRTMVTLFETPINLSIEGRQGEKHNARADCIWQIKRLCEIWKVTKKINL